MGLLYGENCMILTFNRFRLIHPCDWWTDRWTIAYSALSMLSHAKNCEYTVNNWTYFNCIGIYQIRLEFWPAPDLAGFPKNGRICRSRNPVQPSLLWRVYNIVFVVLLTEYFCKIPYVQSTLVCHQNVYAMMLWRWDCVDWTACLELVATGLLWNGHLLSWRTLVLCSVEHGCSIFIPSLAFFVSYLSWCSLFVPYIDRDFEFYRFNSFYKFDEFVRILKMKFAVMSYNMKLENFLDLKNL